MLTRSATTDEVLPLRALVLRDGGPLDSARFAEDAAATHVVADDAGAVVACATGFPAPHDGRPAWRIRGVAVAPERRGEGLGALVVRALIEAAGADLFWCTARLSALGFWERMGFTAEGDELVLPHGGVHRVMVRRS